MSLDRVEGIKRFRVLEIMDLVMRINGTEPTGRVPERNKMTVFARFSGHVAAVSVEIYRTGWDLGSKPSVELRGHLGDDKEMEDIIAVLVKTLAEREKSS